ncbi:BTB/POZ domain-containing protein POB1 [Raphanus sativus]|uniref:BTB/POZ domain-containing protein POB1 isoform X2 n=1 Tax=Raphanus sativus TaxID=3726 RepID=A0A6J0KF81_RAPSA|nr:BTB/POZ domain-containing protein POB1 isoform X2 [Raphanus sativus]KAJ4884898.1 BTB/POZ domain-containing protein POB1 [Raphanus sativus]
MRGGENTDLFDPKTQMDSEFSRHGSSPEGDFGFAFNDSNFSDRLLRIEIMGGGPSDSRSDVEGCCTSIADWARHRKRRREDIKKESVTISDIVACPEEQILTDEQPDMDGCPGGDNLDDEGEAMIEEALSGDEEDTTSEPSWGMDCSKVVRVIELHISSPILAAKSPFFYKLFSNGMRESEQRHVTLRINASEEAALMELLNFMYSNVVSVATAPALLDVLMAADKFEVASCMRYCSRLLRNMPMTPESALLYLELPSSVLMAKAVQPLTDAAKQFLAARYKDITKFQEEVMSLPLAGIEAILSSDDLQIASEDAVYDFILKWARAQYPVLEERREVLGSRLALSIRFPFMTCRKLKKVLTCSDFDHEIASKLVLEALFFKAEAPHRQRSLAAEESASVNRRLIERAYKYRPVKVVEFELPRPQCVVYLDLKREECAGLFPSGRVYSQAFHLGGQGFFLSAHCNMDQQSSFHCFGLFLGMQEKGSVSFGVDYEFSARSKPTEEFISKYKGNYTFTGGKAVGYRNLFGIPWTSFIAEDSLYFINGILHLRAELTIKRSTDPPPQ